MSPDSQRINLGAQGLNLHGQVLVRGGQGLNLEFLLLVGAGERDHIIKHIGDQDRVLPNIFGYLGDVSKVPLNIRSHRDNIALNCSNIILEVINIS